MFRSTVVPSFVPRFIPNLSTLTPHPYYMNSRLHFRAVLHFMTFTDIRDHAYLAVLPAHDLLIEYRETLLCNAWEPRLQGTSQSPNLPAESKLRTVYVCDLPVGDIKPHPSYARHRLSVPAASLSALAELGDLAFKQPLVITRNRFIVDGYGRWELAKRQKRPTLPCLEYDLDEREALRWLIRTQRRRHALNDFIRIELALDLEPRFKEAGLTNRREGGRLKGLSKLTTAEKVNSRAEIARVAHVSVGNVHKVKLILMHACIQVQEAARTEEVSINLADKWSHEPEAKQIERLRVLRIERGIRRKARQLVSAELAKESLAKHAEQKIKLSDIVGVINELTVNGKYKSTEFASLQIENWMSLVRQFS